MGLQQIDMPETIPTPTASSTRPASDAAQAARRRQQQALPVTILSKRDL
jgi:hypothetical protein